MIQISPRQKLVIGETWKKVLDLVPQNGTLTISSVADYLMKKDSTTNVDSSFVTGEPSSSGNQVTTGQVGTGSIVAGRYTYFLEVTTASNVYTLFQELEFVPKKGH